MSSSLNCIPQIDSSWPSGGLYVPKGPPWESIQTGSTIGHLQAIKILGFWRSATVGQQEGNGVAPCSHWWSAFQRTSWENDRNPKDSQQQAPCWRPVGRWETLNQTWCTYLSEAVSGHNSHTKPAIYCTGLTRSLRARVHVRGCGQIIVVCALVGCCSTVITVGAVWWARYWRKLWFFKGLCLGNQSIFWQAVLCSSQHGPYLSLIKFSSVSANSISAIWISNGILFYRQFCHFFVIKRTNLK